MEEKLKKLEGHSKIEESKKKNILQTMMNRKTISLEFVNCDSSFKEYEQ